MKKYWYNHNFLTPCFSRLDFMSKIWENSKRFCSYKRKGILMWIFYFYIRPFTSILWSDSAVHCYTYVWNSRTLRLQVSIPTYITTYLYTYLPTYLPIPYLYLYTYLPTYLPSYLSILSPNLYLSTYLTTYLHFP